MTEVALAITNLLFGVAILVYFYFKETKKRQSEDDEIGRSHQFYKDISFSKDELINNISASKDNLVNQNFVAYLKHIQSLEKMVLPKPVTRGMVDEILMRGPQPAEENDIEKTTDEVERDDFMEVFKNIPIDSNTTVAFENEIEQLPEEIIK